MKRDHEIVLSLLRGVCIALFTLAVYAITTLTFWGFAATENSLAGDMETYVICIFCTATVPFIFNSVVLAFSYSDRRRIEEFLAREDRSTSFKGEMRALFTGPPAIAELISTHLILITAALLGAFFSFDKMFPSGMPVGNWLAAVTVTPVCFILTLIAKYEAARLYSKSARDGDIDKYMTTRWLALRIAIIFILYPIAAPFAPILLYAGITAFSIFAKLSTILTTVGLILLILLLVFAFWGFKVLRGMSKRKKFIKRLFEVAALEGYEICELKNPYRSFVTSKTHCSFLLKKDGHTFDCLALSTIWHGAALVFTSPTDAYFAHRLGTKNHHITLRHNIDFYHRGEGRRIVIVDPVPRDVLIEDCGKQQRVHCSDVLWNITVHDSDSFIGCVDRNCLDAKSSYREN